MAKNIDITIHNKLVVGRRDMNIYHHSTRSAHMISFDSSVTLPFSSIKEDDYLHISIVSGPGRLEGNCMVNLPSWIDFELFSKGDVTIAHSRDRILVKIPPGLPEWQLKMTQSLSSITHFTSDRVTIGDIQQE